MTIAETNPENPWAAFAPTVLEIPEDRWEEFFRTAPADTLIALGRSFEELYLKGASLYWTDLQSIDQPYYDEDVLASLHETSPSDLLAYAASFGRHGTVTVKVLRLGSKA